jgi:tetratricopeptide (TPR) repeat protein
LLVDAGRSGLALQVHGQVLRLDTAGNPEESPLYGKGPGPRKALWDELTVLCQEIETGRAKERIAGLRASHAEALREAPMRLATDLLLARSLALGADNARAIDVLRSGLADMPDDSDLRLRLGEQLAIAGERRAAMTELGRAAQIHTVGRNPYDAEIVWMIVAGLEADAAEMQKVLAFVRGVNNDGPSDVARSRVFTGLWAFFRGEWRDDALRSPVEPIDMPFMSVIAGWAALERGADSAAIAKTAAALAANPEARDVARLLGAHALVRAGRAAEAQPELVSALEVLARKARADVLALAWLALAHHVGGEVATALGDRRAATEHFHEAARIAPKCWFGRPPAKM